MWRNGFLGSPLPWTREDSCETQRWAALFNPVYVREGVLEREFEDKCTGFSTMGPDRVPWFGQNPSAEMRCDPEKGCGAELWPGSRSKRQDRSHLPMARIPEGGY